MRKDNSLCLILEGGGAKCSYQAGVMTILDEFGYKYDAIGGTSFGSLNGALYLAGGIKRVNEFWDNCTAGAIFGDDRLNYMMDDIYHKRDLVNSNNAKAVLNSIGDKKFYSYVSNSFHNYVINSVNEEEVRNSGIDFGLVTIEIPKLTKTLLEAALTLFNPVEAFYKIVKFNQSDNKLLEGFKGKPLELVNEAIPEGKLAEFVAASSAIQSFKPIEIDGVYYTDGGIYDNQPVNMMARRGYDHYILIRTNNYDITGHYSDKLDVKVIAPDESIGSCAMFASDNIKALRELGMKDAIKFLDDELKTSFSYRLRRREVISKYNINI